MSSFVKTAAMTLLSKTLQTLLYKYLSEVDVEGVNLPSLYNSDGHSGWGVRLSNVKLREGAKLMDLPGGNGSGSKSNNKRKNDRKRRRKRRRRKPQRKGKKGGDTERGINEEASTIPPDPPDYDAVTPTKKQPTSRENDADNTDEHQVASTKPYDAETQAAAAAAAAAGDEDATQSTLETASTTTTTMTSTTATAHVNSSSGSTTAATAPARTTSGWFSWYRRTCPQPVLQEETEFLVEEAVDDTGRETPDATRSSTVDAADGDNKPLDPALLGENDSNKKDGGDDGTDQSEEGDFYYSESEGEEELEDEDNSLPPLILRLGKDSRIGTLDVRLIGSVIHVYVEDADLSIEAVRVAVAQADDTAKETTDKGDQGGNNTKGSPEKKPSFRSGSAKKETDEPKTAGERVLAENALARALSALPNLFIRDVRVRFVMRDAVVQPSPDTASNNKGSDEPQQTSSFSEESETKYGPNDSIVDFTIEMLSITDGADFLASYRGDLEEETALSPSEDLEEERFPPAGGNDDIDYYDDQNEYLVKRIRTGRGPDGGITLRIYPPCRNVGVTTNQYGPPWARRRWESMVQACFLRLSGLDLQGRMYIGTKTDSASNDGWMDSSEYDEEYHVDAMLFGGVDYIAPGPQPPLPPMSTQPQPMLGEEKFWTHEGATVYQTDANGIQSSAVNSSFHRVARGLTPAICDGDHLPCENCPKCWETLPGCARTHPLDASTPMGGLTLSVILRDTLEINIDRESLEVIGDAMGMFKKPATDSSPQEPDEDKRPADEEAADEIGESSRGFLSPMSSSRNLEAESVALEEEEAEETTETPPGRRLRSARSDIERECLKTSFPEYMQPEAIQILGIHISDLILRVQVMGDGLARDEGLSFCFWDVQSKCLTFDYQALDAPERNYQDLRFDIAYFITQEYIGPADKQILSIGMRKRVVEFDDMTIETLKTLEELSDRPPWPSTAAALLDVQPPLETLLYEDRDRHALQMRYISVSDPSDIDPQRRRSHAYIRIGPASVDVRYEIKDQIPTIISEARQTVFGPPEENRVEPSGDSECVQDEERKPRVDDLMRYKLHLDGGRVILAPTIEMKLPLTVITGDRSSEFGLFFETLLEKVNFSYGEQDVANRALQRGLSLQQLASCPESVRLRILLFLPDLKPLEKALCIKPEKDSFLRCRSVNKGIVKVAKRAARRGRNSGLATSKNKSANRRQELMAELLALDDDTLEDLVMAHKRYNMRKS